jgi:uncharacterized coiled-coil protein SlyX
MAKTNVPSNSRELITMLDKRFPDRLDTLETQSEFQRGKVAGVVELLRELKQIINKEI